MVEYTQSFRLRRKYPQGATKEIVEAEGFGTQGIAHPAYNARLDNRQVEPTSGGDTNPLFAPEQPDSVRLGTRKMVAKIILQGGANTKWAYCQTHDVVVYLDKDGVFRDWVSGKHMDRRDPLNNCRIVAINPNIIAQLDSKVAEMLGSLNQVAETLTESIAESKQAKRKFRVHRHQEEAMADYSYINVRE
jgi:hypothetical protein